MYEVINVKRPHHSSGLYGVEILSKNSEKIAQFHNYWMELVGKQWQIFFQGGSHEYPNSDWILFEFWTAFDNTKMDQLIDYSVVIAQALDLKVNIV